LCGTIVSGHDLGQEVIDGGNALTGAKNRKAVNVMDLLAAVIAGIAGVLCLGVIAVIIVDAFESNCCTSIFADIGGIVDTGDEVAAFGTLKRKWREEIEDVRSVYLSVNYLS
jgi:hypothetical protein